MWLYNPQRKKGLTQKMQRPWQGPYVITKQINDLVYRIQLGPRAKPKVVHRNRLWRYSGMNVPTWYHAPEQEQSVSSNETISETPTVTSGAPEQERSTSPVRTTSETLTTSSNELPTATKPLRQSDRKRHPPVRFGT